MALPTPYYQDEFIRIYCCDNREFTGKTVDHIITDPPYSSKVHDLHQQRRQHSIDGLQRAQLGFSNIEANNLRELLSRVRVRRWLVMTLDEYLTTDIRDDPPPGWRYIRTGIWVKPGAMPAFTGDRPSMGWEPVPILHSTSTKLRWNGGGRDSVWKYNVVHGEHPTEKPLGLYKSFIGLFTDPGDVVLDPYMGSGTTPVACKEMGRKCVAIDYDERNCEIAVARLTSARGRRISKGGRKEADFRARGYTGLFDEVATNANASA